MSAELLVEEDVHVTEAICRVLEQAGIDAVFGLSGGNTGRIFSRLAFHADTVRTVMVRNEAYATVAAEAYAKTSGKLAVAMGQGSWLLGHGVVGTLEARLSGIPMLLLGDLSDGAPFSQHGPYQSGTGEYGSWNARLAFSGLVKEVFEPHSPVQAVQHVQLAIKHARAGQPGPVAVLFHSEALVGEVGPLSVPRLYATEAYLQGGSPAVPDLGSVTQALLSAEQPVIVAGGGVRLARAQDLLLAIAERVGAPVVTTASGKGTFPEEHPLAGGVFGNFGSPLANELVAAADVVLALGTKLGPSDTALESSRLMDPVRQQILQFDVEPLNAGWTYPAAHVVVGELTSTLRALAQELEEHQGVGFQGGTRVAALAARRASSESETAHAGSTVSPLHPQRVIAELRRSLPDDAIVCADAGENRLLMCRYFEVHRTGEYLQPAGAGGMGYAIPAALGAKLCEPQRTVVAVCGDGGFSMSLSALFSAVEEKLPILVVVFVNGALGWVKHSQRARGEQEYKSTLQRFNYAAIGKAMGFEASSVSGADQLGAAVTEAVKSGAPSLIVTDVSTEQTFLDLRTPLMM